MEDALFLISVINVGDNSERVIGICRNETAAIRCITSNAGDMHECYYDCAKIIKIPNGVSFMIGEEYKTFIWDAAKDAFVEIENREEGQLWLMKN